MKPIKQRIAEVAPSVDLGPKPAQLLRNFFLDLATQEEKDELDTWLNASDANSRFFDLMLEINKDGLGTAVIATINKLTQAKRIKWSLWGKIVLGFMVVYFLLFIYDRFMEAHPIEKWMYGKRFGDVNTGLDSVATGADAKTVWLVDSTRVDLGPNSKIIFPNELSWYRRKVQVIGNATIELRSEEKGEFLVRYGDLEQKVATNGLLVIDKGILTLQPLNP